MACTDMNSACASASTVTLRRCGAADVQRSREVRAFRGLWRTFKGCITVLGDGRNWRKLVVQALREMLPCIGPGTPERRQQPTAGIYPREETDGHQIPQRERQAGHGHDRRSGHAAALRAAQRSRSARAALRLRPRAMRRLHGARRRQGRCAPASRRSPSLKAGQKIVTLEGLGTPQKPHPLQQAFIDEQAVQCGYCINGMIMQAAALLRRNKKPSEAQIQQALAEQPLPLRHARAHRARREARVRARPEGGDHDTNITLSRRECPQGRAARSSSPSRFAAAIAGEARAGCAPPARPLALDRGRRLPRHRRQGRGHGLLRQGRSRHRRAHRAHADRRRGARRAARPRQRGPGRHRAHARPGRHLGQPHRSRSAACRSGRPRATARERAARRRPPSSSASRRASLDGRRTA